MTRDPLDPPPPSDRSESVTPLPGETTAGQDDTLAADLRAAREFVRAPELPGYQVVRQLSEGGQGIVFAAVQSSTKRKVAIKVLRDGAYASHNARRRFEREIELVAQLKHPNIIGIFDSGATPDGRQYYVMDYVRGAPLHMHVRERRLPLEDSLRLFVSVARAMQYAHQRGIVHRDLKPSNVLVDVHGDAKILDFGLAKWLAAPVDSVVSVSQQIIGTLPYMSPEQTKGNPDEIDARTDVYALGVMLYQTLTGTFPYPVDGSVPDVLRHISSTPPTPPRKQWSRSGGIPGRSSGRSRPGACPIDAELETILLKALAKEPTRRYASAGALAADLERYLAGESIEARPDSVLYLLRKSLRRHRGGFIAAALLFAAVAAAVYYGVTVSRRAARDHEQASGALAAERRARERITAEAADRERRLREANAWLDAGLALLDRPAERARAARLIQDAVQQAPELERSWIARGLLRVRDGLAAELDHKAAHADAAIADFLQAHVAAGGAVPADMAVKPSGGPAGAGRGSPAALWMMGELLTLDDRAADAEPVFRALDDALRAAESDAAPVVTRSALAPASDDPLRPRTAIDETRGPAAEPFILRQLLRGEIQTLNPLRTSDYDRYIADLLFERLFCINAELRCVWNPNVLAGGPGEGYEQNPDERTWRVRLQRGLRWHDGEPFTAHDVAYTCAILRPDGIASATAEDDDTVRFTMREALAPERARYAMSFYIVPRHIAEQAPVGQLSALDENPIGSGPFRVKRREGARLVELARWEDYPGPKPRLAGIVFEHLDGADERAAALAAGRAHVAELSSAEYRWFVHGRSFDGRVYKISEPTIGEYDFLCWNFAGNPFFRDLRVRRAMTLAIDLEMLRTVLTGALYSACSGPFVPGTWMADERDPLLPYDPKGAATLLDEAGWRLSAAGGLRVRAGQPFEFTLLAPDDAIGRGVGILVRQQLAAIGVRVELDLQPWNGDYKARLRQGRFDAALSGVRSVGHPAGATAHFLKGGSRNDGGYDNADIADRFAAAGCETDEAEEIRRYQNLRRDIYEDQPYTFLWQKRPLWAFNARVRGVTVSRIGPVGFQPGPRAWWVLAE